MHGEWGNWRLFSCLVRQYKCRRWRGVGAYRLFLVLPSNQRVSDPFASLSPWHPSSAFVMDSGKRPAGDAFGDRQSMRRHLTRVGSLSDGEHGRPLPLAVSLEPAQPSDVAPAAAAESKLETQEVPRGLPSRSRGDGAGDAGRSRPTGGCGQPMADEFSISHSGLTSYICFFHLSCSYVEQS
jgi:hypothetical protein